LLTNTDSQREPVRFVHRYLDPGERLGEIIFGLIMVLTFTSTARATLGESEDSATELLIATLGCNIAWGIIDGGMYLMSAMLDRARESRPSGVHTDDLKGALACCWLVIASTCPVAIPFMIFHDAYFALRVSNALLIAMLFIVGVQWGTYAKVNKWRAGLVFTVVGLILVAIAIALGG
jgi:hypothetical protein